ncbi:hypothetical protein E1890_22640 [Salmonella enterica subsp. enterica serovar Mountpleasant]|nr:hypothetical protein [Salmonella enterica subsp. enterica serovar Mountpleasant]
MPHQSVMMKWRKADNINDPKTANNLGVDSSAREIAGNGYSYHNPIFIVLHPFIMQFFMAY